MVERKEEGRKEGRKEVRKEEKKERRKEGRKEGNRKRENQSPKGIMRSAVPLPCFFDVEKSQRVAGQRHQEGTKSCRNSVCLSIHPPIIQEV